MTAPTRAGDPEVERALRWYRVLLVAYPRDFRNEFGDDLIQGARDLMIHHSMGPSGWWRMLRDLVVSAPKERAASLSGPPRNGWSPLVVGLIVVASVGLVVVGSGPGFLILVVPGLLLIGLPALGVAQFWMAWRAHRTVGAGSARHLLFGTACFVPAPVALALLGEDSGWYIFIGVAGGVIMLAVTGIVWAIVALTQRRSTPSDGGRKVGPTVALVAGVVVLAGIVGASYNSYRNSLGPPGDHSVENASADTRALWEAANDGDLVEVQRLTAETCADPWVKFPVGNGRHNAKGQAEARMLEIPDDQDDGFEAAADHIGGYMDLWTDRCNTTD